MVFSQKMDFEPQSVAIHPGLTEVAIGGDERVSVVQHLTHFTGSSFNMLFCILLHFNIEN